MNRRTGLDRIIERALAAEHRADQVERNISRRQRFGHQSSSETMYRPVAD
jgi:hypothetical protein